MLKAQGLTGDPPLSRDWWVEATQLDEKLSTATAGEPRDAPAYVQLSNAWSHLDRHQQVRAWELLTAQGYYALADAIGHQLPFEEYVRMKQASYDQAEAELHDLLSQINDELEQREWTLDLDAEAGPALT